MPSEQAAGSPITLLPARHPAAAGCFTVSGSTLSISSMPARASAAPVTVTVGVAGAANYVYTSPPAAPATPSASSGVTGATVSWVAPAANGGAITVTP